MFICTIAGQEIVFSCPISILAPLAIRPPEPPSLPHIQIDPQAFIARTAGWVAGAEYPVEVWSGGEGLILRVSDFRDFYIAPAGSAILPRSGSPELTSTETEVVLGPALVLALALGGRWCLHASAAMYHGHLFVFLGESGDGKSTMAEHLSTQPGWTRIADDILPVSISSGSLLGWAQFPQLKLAPEDQPMNHLPPTLPIHTICLLAPADHTQAASLELCTRVDGLQVLLAHTAGARLFPASLLADHLEFSSAAARLAAIYRLSYPHSFAKLPQVQSLLEASTG